MLGSLAVLLRLRCNCAQSLPKLRRVRLFDGVAVVVECFPADALHAVMRWPKPLLTMTHRFWWMRSYIECSLAAIARAVSRRKGLHFFADRSLLPSSAECLLELHHCDQFIALRLSKSQRCGEGVGLVGKNFQVVGCSCFESHLGEPGSILR